MAVFSRVRVVEDSMAVTDQFTWTSALSLHVVRGAFHYTDYGILGHYEIVT